MVVAPEYSQNEYISLFFFFSYSFSLSGSITILILLSTLLNKMSNSNVCFFVYSLFFPLRRFFSYKNFSTQLCEDNVAEEKKEVWRYQFKWNKALWEKNHKGEILFLSLRFPTQLTIQQIMGEREGEAKIFCIFSLSFIYIFYSIQ